MCFCQKLSHKIRMRIVYQKSVVNPQICIPICHLNDDVGEHIVIVRNPERAISIQSILRDDGGVDHPLLEDTVYDDLHSIQALANSPEGDHPQQALVTPPRIQRSTQEGQLDTSGSAPPECWKAKFSLTVLELLKLFDKSISSSLGQLSFAPIGMSYPLLLHNITMSNKANAYEFLHAMRERNRSAISHELTMQMQVLLFLCGLNVGPGRESIISSEYPSILISSSESSHKVTRVFLHPQSAIFRIEQNLFSKNDPSLDWERLLAETADIGDGPYLNMEFSSVPEDQKRLYRISCSYMCGMRRCVRNMIEDHGIIPFNVGFATYVWLTVIRNIETNNVHTLGIEGDALKLVDSIFGFYYENDEACLPNPRIPYSHSQSASLMYTLNGDTIAWLVHPVEEIYSL